MALFGLLLVLTTWPLRAADDVDTALIVSVDVSNSVDAQRYKLQMEGIAQALEDPEVIDAITSGANGGILFSMVTWADKPRIAIPWRRIASAADSRTLALEVRALPQQGGEFTCLTGMLRNIADKVVTQIPVKATRIIIDVSGDGKENCNPKEPTTEVRDELVAGNVTINGLPILEGDQGASLEAWYRENVMGGGGAFVLPAQGFEDFGRAIRQKFVIEMSMR
ncbi:MAG: DUF1194 domain-containing protein [Hyphomicrobium sp.]